MEPTEAARVEGSDRFTRAAALAGRFLDNIESVVYGKREEVKLVVAALISGGHVLFEDVPGTAKTVLARAIAQSIDGATPSRIQCTPDLQPTDVTGLSVFNQKERDFEFRPGPIFANVVLVDEINRAMPKTQSALLEAMAEQQVTVDGETRVLPDPFLLLATENPIEYEGTFPLPEAQLDRFFLRTALGYPHADDERRILEEQRHGHPLRLLEPVIGVEDVQELKAAAQAVYVDELIKCWIVDLVRATREDESVAIGASVRGSLALERAARGWALLSERGYVVPDDVDRLFLPVLMHRVVFRPAFLAEARRSGWAAAAERFRDACLARAPRPAADPDAEVFALGERRT
jgi:MoxR-like ATPase